MPYDNRNRGTLAKNPRKEADNHPDIKGSINVEGRDYWLDGWQKTNSKDGSTFYSLTVKPKEDRPRRDDRRQDRSSYADRDDPRTHGGRDLDDDIPFIMEWR